MLTVPLDKAYRLVNHGPLLLVSTTSGEHADVAPIAWASPYDRSPARFLLTMDPGHQTFRNILATGEAVINVPGPGLVAEAMRAGEVSGAEVADKFAYAGLEPLSIQGMQAPGVAGCTAWIGARLVEPQLARQYGIVMLEAVCAFVVEGGLTASGHVDVEHYPALHHLGGSVFCRSGPLVVSI